MREKLQLHIPEPCHEDWDQMTPVEQGRFCTSCQKNVIDFVHKTDEEIIDFFKNYHGDVCGSFNDDQLQRPIEVIELKPASSFLKYAASLLLPAVMIGNKLNAQKKDVKELKEIIVTGYGKRVGKAAFTNTSTIPIEKKSDSSLTPKNIDRKIDSTKIPIVRMGGVARISEKELLGYSLGRIHEKDTFQFKPLKPRSIEQLLSGKITCFSIVQNASINGIVLDEQSGAPLQGATVLLKGTTMGTVTDMNGKFSIKTNDKKGSVLFSYVGFLNKEIKVADLSLDNQQVYLSPSTTTGLLGEVIVVGYPRRMGGATGGLSIRYEKPTPWNKLMDTLLPSKVKIYPNPVSSSGTINLLFPNVKEGLYQIRLLNAAGQLFYSVQKQINGKNETEQIHLNSQMLPGIYMVQIIDAQKKLLQTSRLIVQ